MLLSVHSKRVQRTISHPKKSPFIKRLRQLLRRSQDNERDLFNYSLFENATIDAVWSSTFRVSSEHYRLFVMPHTLLRISAISWSLDKRSCTYPAEISRWPFRKVFSEKKLLQWNRLNVTDIKLKLYAVSAEFVFHYFLGTRGWGLEKYLGVNIPNESEK